jgi:vacuolar protein sorting-associated protein 26
MKDGAQETLLVFTDKDPVKGEVTLKMESGKRLEHVGVKIEFIGQIEMFYGNMHEFIAMVRDLDAPGASRFHRMHFSHFCTKVHSLSN